MKLALLIFVLPIILLMNISSAYADWNESSLFWVKNYNSEKPHFSDGAVATAWGAIRIGFPGSSETEFWKLPCRHFEHDKFEVAALVQRDQNQNTVVAPLIIALPGMFNDDVSGGSRRAIERYSDRGYHVVVLSNPWSEAYIRQKPDFFPGDIKSESQLVLDMIPSIIKKIGRENISRVELVGESYGALQAAIVFGMDQRSSTPLIDGNVTLFSPPEDLRIGEQQLDQGREDTQNLFVDSCSSKKNLINVAQNLLEHLFESEMGKDVELCAPPLVYGSFQESLVKSTELIHQIYGIGNIPQEASAHKNWAVNLRFLSMIDEYFPQIDKLLLQGERGSLAHWINQLSPESLKHLRIMTAQDDFLNIRTPWPTNTPAFSSEILVQLPWGGHMGYESLPGFKHLLDAAFQAQPVQAVP